MIDKDIARDLEEIKQALMDHGVIVVQSNDKFEVGHVFEQYRDLIGAPIRIVGLASTQEADAYYKLSGMIPSPIGKFQYKVAAD